MSEHTLDGEAWEFPARLVNIVDGDTFDLEFDLGFRTHRQARVRLFGIDTAEVYGVSEDSAEYKRGKEHEAFVRQWFMFENHDRDEDFPLNVTTLKDKGKYGRYIAVIRGPYGDSLTAALSEEFDDV